MSGKDNEKFINAMSGLSGLAAREAIVERDHRLIKFIRTHESALDEALALVGAVAKAILDRRITTTERNECVRKAEAFIRALNSAKEEE